MALKSQGQPDGAAPYGQPTEIYPAKLLAVASGATALEPSVRVEGRANLLLVSYLSSFASSRVCSPASSTTASASLA